MIKEDIDMAYVAGIMDGDGSFSIIKINKQPSAWHYPFLQFVNLNEELINYLKESFGGTIVLAKKHICNDGSFGRQAYRWRLRSCVNVIPFLEKVAPFLKIKKERAELLLKFSREFSFIRGVTLSNDKIAERDAAYLKMTHFNHWTSFNNNVSGRLAKENTLDPIFWSYFAGLMDTDGSFSVKCQRSNKGTHVINSRYLPVISLSMTDVRAINYIRENFCFGKLYIPKNKSCKNGFHYQLGIYTKKECIELLNNIIPYLRSKAENAKILLDFCLNSENTKYCKAGINKEELAFRHDCYVRLVEMNRYGVSKSSLIVLKPLPGDAEGNKEQAGDALVCEAVQLERSKREDDEDKTTSSMRYSDLHGKPGEIG